MPPAGRRRRFQAGRLEATWDVDGLRWITFEGVEVVRGILVTARDAGWRTVQPEIRRVRVVADSEAFSVSFDARFRAARLEIDCRVTFEGSESGRIESRFAASVASESVVQRLGLIVLHPAAVAGRPFETTGAGGSTQGVFPELVIAERFATGYQGMRWDAGDGLTASLGFDGDLWETEDQRAWTDASFKSYSPPLSRPHPVTWPAGAGIEAALRLDVARAAAPADPATTQRRPTVESVIVRDDLVGPLPPIGLEWSRPLIDGEAAALRELAPSHLRVVIDRNRDDWRSELDQAARDAAAIGTALQLELVAFSTGEARDELAVALDSVGVSVASVLAFGTTDDAGLVTSEATHVNELRRRLEWVIPGVPVGGGSRANYAELAAAALPLDLLDTVAFPVTPQAHATDPATIIENLATLPVLMQSAKVLGGGRPLDLIGSFRPRFDAYADPPERRLSSTRFDDRLAGELGSAWLIGMLAGILSGGAACVTTLEASGPGGVLGSPGLAATLTAVLTMRGGHVLWTDAGNGCAALAVRAEDSLRLVVVNLRERATTVRIDLSRAWQADAAVARSTLAPLEHRVIDARLA
jgi:hypothetical protein